MKYLRFLLPAFLLFTQVAFLRTQAQAIATPQAIQRNILQNAAPGLLRDLIPQNQWQPFPKTAQGWKEILPDSTIKGIIDRGQEALKTVFSAIPATVILEFVRTGNRVHYENLSFEKRNALFDLALAESMEGKGRFTDQVLNGVWSICEESYWGLPAHLGGQKAGPGLPDVQDPYVDLFAAETAAVLAWTDYFAGPALEKISKLVRPRIYYEVNRRVLAPMLVARYSYLGFDGKKINNWDPWIMSNYINANLLLEKDEQQRKHALELAMQYTDAYINWLGEDGGCDEGPGYWSAAGGSVFDVLNLLSDACGGKTSLYDAPIIKKMGSYIYKTHIAGNYFINVADAHPELQPDGYMLFRFGKAIGDTIMMSFGSWMVRMNPSGDASYEKFRRMRTLFDLKVIKEAALYPAKEPNVPDAWFSDVQLMASRNKAGFFVSTHAGNNGESHNHNDVGDFILYANGQPVIIDVGSGTYTSRTFSRQRYDLWFNTSAYHNLPVINGFQQGTGERFGATQVQYQLKKQAAALSMDLATAYPAEAGIKSWIRTVNINKNAATVSISDQFAVASPLKSFTQNFMTVCEVDISKKGIIGFSVPGGRLVKLQYDGSIFTAAVEKVVLTTPEDQQFKHSWNGKDIYRVILSGKSAGNKGIFKYIIN